VCCFPLFRYGFLFLPPPPLEGLFFRSPSFISKEQRSTQRWNGVGRENTMSQYTSYISEDIFPRYGPVLKMESMSSPSLRLMVLLRSSPVLCHHGRFDGFPFFLTLVVHSGSFSPKIPSSVRSTISSPELSDPSASAPF